MAELATLARPYARAAFDAAREDGDDGLARWSEMLAFLAGALGIGEVATKLAAPDRTDEGKAQMLIELCGEQINPRGGNFVHVLAANKRLALLPEIADQFEDLRAEHERTLEVEIVSARALSEADAAKLREKLAGRFQREIDLTNSVDASLLGGAIIRAGDTVIDGSIRGRLSKLADNLRIAQ